MYPSQLASPGRKIYFKITSRLSFRENIDSFYGEETIFRFKTLTIKNVKKANFLSGLVHLIFARISVDEIIFLCLYFYG